MKKILLGGAVAMVVASQAMADGMYGGVGLGSTDYDVPGLGSGTGFQVKLGYQMNDNFAVEGGYLDAGDVSITDDGDRYSIEGSAMQLGLRASTPINDSYFGYFKLGLARGELEGCESGFGCESETSNELYYGVGAGWNFSDSGRVTLDYQVIPAEVGDEEDSVDLDFSTLSIGVEFKF